MAKIFEIESGGEGGDSADVSPSQVTSICNSCSSQCSSSDVNLKNNSVNENYVNALIRLSENESSNEDICSAIRNMTEFSGCGNKDSYVVVEEISGNVEGRHCKLKLFFTRELAHYLFQEIISFEDVMEGFVEFAYKDIFSKNDRDTRVVCGEGLLLIFMRWSWGKNYLKTPRKNEIMQRMNQKYNNVIGEKKSPADSLWNNASFFCSEKVVRRLGYRVDYFETALANNLYKALIRFCFSEFLCFLPPPVAKVNIKLADGKLNSGKKKFCPILVGKNLKKGACCNWLDKNSDDYVFAKEVSDRDIINKKIGARRSTGDQKALTRAREYLTMPGFGRSDALKKFVSAFLDNKKESYCVDLARSSYLRQDTITITSSGELSEFFKAVFRVLFANFPFFIYDEFVSAKNTFCGSKSEIIVRFTGNESKNDSIVDTCDNGHVDVNASENVINEKKKEEVSKVIDNRNGVSSSVNSPQVMSHEDMIHNGTNSIIKTSPFDSGFSFNNVNSANGNNIGITSKDELLFLNNSLQAASTQNSYDMGSPNRYYNDIFRANAVNRFSRYFQVNYSTACTNVFTGGIDYTSLYQQPPKNSQLSVINLSQPRDLVNYAPVTRVEIPNNEFTYFVNSNNNNIDKNCGLFFNNQAPTATANPTGCNSFFNNEVLFCPYRI